MFSTGLHCFCANDPSLAGANISDLPTMQGPESAASRDLVPKLQVIKRLHMFMVVGNPTNHGFCPLH